ncbi:MAG: SMP-30/gluconolactonase/LRE family protein [Rhizobiaceae bacterium]|nr:SMP-30/gluconolactonase/LRE family protein [Rhizobiaceae bacterium]
MLRYSIERIGDTRDKLGESPLWVEDGPFLYWIDIREVSLHWMDMRTRAHRSRALPKIPGAVVTRRKGGLLMVFRSALAVLETPDAEPQFLTLDFDMGDQRFNDAKCDARGRLWVGTLDRQLKSDAAALYRIDAALNVEQVDAPFTLGNGLAWSPDYTSMYFTDTRTRTIHRYDFDLATGVAANRRTFARVDEEGAGRPDGCAMDAEGFLWSAMIGGGRIARFDPDGRLAQDIRLPIKNPTSCCFGGTTLSTLYVTSATETSMEGLTDEPLEGGLFAVETDVRGMPVGGYGD